MSTRRSPWALALSFLVTIVANSAVCVLADTEAWESAPVAKVAVAKSCKMENGQCGGECSGDNKGKLCRPDPDDSDSCTCQLPNEGECRPKGDGCEGSCPTSGGACIKREGVCTCASNCSKSQNACSGSCVGKAADGSPNPCKADGDKCKCGRICKTVTVTDDATIGIGQEGCGDVNSGQCQRARANCLEKLANAKCGDGYSEQPGSSTFNTLCEDVGGSGVTIPKPSLPSILPFGSLSSLGSGDPDPRAQMAAAPAAAAAAPVAAFEKCQATCSKVCCKN